MAPIEDRFPALNDAVLDIEKLTALFRDYRECTVIGEILAKPGPGYVPTGSQPSLGQAEELLQTRAVRGVQIRYRYGESNWCDTLMPVADGIRLVRIQELQR